MPDLWSSEKITFRDKEACAKRELDMRRRVFPRRVSDGKMRQADADREIEVMEAIHDDYRKAAELEVSGRERFAVIIIPEIETVVILVPRTASRSLKLAIAEAYPRSMQLYRHMEADGTPHGYDRWRRIGVVRNPVDRLWSLYKYIQVMGGQQDGLGKWEPAYVEAQRRSVELPFDEWISTNQTVFTGPYDSAGRGAFLAHIYGSPSFAGKSKSQFIYLRPDLGTHVVRFDRLGEIEELLQVNLGHEHRTEGERPALSMAATDHMAPVFQLGLLGVWG